MIKCFEDLKGNVLKSIAVNEDKDAITFTLADGQQCRLWHSQDCCESVIVDDIAGDLSDLLDSPLLQAEEATSDTNPEGVEMGYQDSYTWTFYKLATIKGSVTIRWYGASNGYYSESVNFAAI